VSWFADNGNFIAAVIQGIAAVVTGIATVFLWLVTKSLATETRRMAEATSRPHIVASVQPNRWALNHADIRVDNTGTGTAYDVSITFDPPLPRDNVRQQERGAPLHHISVLRPGQFLISYVCAFSALLDNGYTVRITWHRDSAEGRLEEHRYRLEMSEWDSFNQLGPSDPLVQIADQVKLIREDWQHVARGANRTRVDVFTSRDRRDEQRQREEWRNEMMRRRAAESGQAHNDEGGQS
jgi:hypothetical protein